LGSQCSEVEHSKTEMFQVRDGLVQTVDSLDWPQKAWASCTMVLIVVEATPTVPK